MTRRAIIAIAVAIGVLCVGAGAALWAQGALPPDLATSQGTDRDRFKVLGQEFGVSIYGEGGTLCSKWTSDAHGSSPNPLQVSWILGFMSAANLTGPAAKKMSPGWMQGFVSGYCEQRPEATLVSAAREMLRFLQSQ